MPEFMTPGLIVAAVANMMSDAPLITNDGEWEQTGWAFYTLDDAPKKLDAPLVSEGLFSLHIRAVPKRRNGWDGVPIHIPVLFDGNKSISDIAEYVNCQMRQAINEIVTRKAAA